MRPSSQAALGFHTYACTKMKSYTKSDAQYLNKTFILIFSNTILWDFTFTCGNQTNTQSLIQILFLKENLFYLLTQSVCLVVREEPKCVE